MALNSAQKLAALAKKYRSEKEVEETANIKTLIATLQSKMTAAAGTGAVYLVLSLEIDGALYTAASTKSGLKFLTEQGFTLDATGRSLVIYWDEPDAARREAMEAAAAAQAIKDAAAAQAIKDAAAAQAIKDAAEAAAGTAPTMPPTTPVT